MHALHYTVIRCHTLPAVENGTVVYSSDSTEPYDYGTIATNQCDSGYELTGGDAVRTCTGDGSSPVGQWNGTAPACLGRGNINTCINFQVPIFSGSCLLWITTHSSQWLSWNTHQYNNCRDGHFHL